MKKIFFSILILFTMSLKSQILFEFAHDSASSLNVSIGGVTAMDQLMIVNFELSGMQYVKVNKHGKYICIYDLSHALIKTISLTSLPANTGNLGYILYLSESLFNTDAKKEFMYSVILPGTNYYTAIYNEDGTILFSDSACPAIIATYPEQQYPIYNTPNGTKMILSYKNGQAKVFGLPGTLTTAIDRTSHAFVGNLSNPMPNPVVSTTQIEYALPKEVSRGEIIFYDTQGIEVKRFKVDNTFTNLQLSAHDIPAGTYYYQLQTTSNSSGAKKMVVIK